VRITFGSMWRDMGPVVRDRLSQYHRLYKALAERGDELTLVLVENDSIDDTYWHLNEFAACGGTMGALLIQAKDGCPHYPSKDIPDRWRHLAWVANHTLDHAGDCDVFLYIESDLLWSTQTALKLIDHTLSADAVCAMNMHADQRYYDIWGSRAQGLRFKRWPPYHPILEDWESGLVPIDSACGAIAMKGEVARQVRFQPEDCFVGLCRDIRSKGFGLWLDPSLEVLHP
jgi:hypothetical protein